MEGLVFLIPVAGIVMAGFVLTPLARAVARRLEGSAAGAERGEVEALKEEWSDFAERLLVRGRESEPGSA